MGQQEVYDFLMKNPDSWYTSKEISEQLVVSIGSVTMSLKKLRKTNIIKYRNTGKRNTFQYMVQSEPAKLQERKSMALEQLPTQTSEQKVRVKIKPKIVHQHTYLSGQTFYGVIRPKEEVEQIERHRSELAANMAAKVAAKQRPRVTAKPTKRITRASTTRKQVKPATKKTLKTRSAARSVGRTVMAAAKAKVKAKATKRKARK